MPRAKALPTPKGQVNSQLKIRQDARIDQPALMFLLQDTRGFASRTAAAVEHIRALHASFRLKHGSHPSNRHQVHRLDSTIRLKPGFLSSASAAARCQLKLAVRRSSGTMPSTAASSSSASIARSSNRATSVRKARPARSSGPSRACHSVSYGLQRGGVGAVAGAAPTSALPRHSVRSAGCSRSRRRSSAWRAPRRRRPPGRGRRRCASPARAAAALQARTDRRERGAVALAETARSSRLNRAAARVARHQPDARHSDVAAA